VNLTLEVRTKRTDGYHDLRTIFHTVSLSDTIELGFSPGRSHAVIVDSNVEITNNLAAAAAERVLSASGARGEVSIRLKKRIPLGGGLGGGSSDAAAILLALPALTGRPITLENLHEISVSLGSDVPFFLLGGCAVAFGRGTELYPLPDGKRLPAAIVVPNLHVSTSDAYRALNRPSASLTSPPSSPKIDVFQSLAWSVGQGLPSEDWLTFCKNDFEEVVFGQHPQLKIIKHRLKLRGARPALMSGSGAAIFGIFPSKDQVTQALTGFRSERTFSVRLVTRRQYRSLWWRHLKQHIIPKTWPPLSRYGR
jgi:4-diphosphocytidyl-2-C-methyl-D-erythritol kinase